MCPCSQNSKRRCCLKFRCEHFAPRYFFADATLVLKFFDHSTNCQRFFFVCANTYSFDSNPLGPIPTGHLCSGADIPPMSRSLQDPDLIPISCHRRTDVEALDPSITPVRGFLTRVGNVSASIFKGSPPFPNYVNNTDGLSSTLLSTSYVSNSDRLYASNPPVGLSSDYKASLLQVLSRAHLESVQVCISVHYLQVSRC